MPVKPRPLSIDQSALRFGLYGPTEGGKTHFLMGLPGVSVIDAESSADAFATRFPAARACPITSPQDVAETFDAFLQGRAGFECESLALDSITAYRRMLQNAPGRRKTGDYADADVNTAITRLLSKIYQRTPFIICVTAHEKRAFSDFEKTQPNHNGMIPDSDPRFSYVFDIVARVVKQGDQRGAIVVKSRFGEIIPTQRFIPNFSYAYVVDALKRARPQAVAAVEQSPANTPSAEDERRLRFDRLKAIHAQVGSPEGTLSAWLSKNGYPTKVGEMLGNRELCLAAYQKLSSLRQAS